MHERIEEIELEALQAQVRLAEELEEVRRSFRAELAVPYRGGPTSCALPTRARPSPTPQRGPRTCKPTGSRSSPRRRSPPPPRSPRSAATRRSRPCTCLSRAAAPRRPRRGERGCAGRSRARRPRQARRPRRRTARRGRAALDELPVAGASSPADAVAQPGSELLAVLRAAEREAGKLSDQYVSTEHLLARARERERPRGGHPARGWRHPERLLEALQEVRGSHRVTDQSPEEKYEALERFGQRPHRRPPSRASSTRSSAATTRSAA